jgi:uncharacterized SAM-binding protein YcdF (DUF218 family)
MKASRGCIWRGIIIVMFAWPFATWFAARTLVVSANVQHADAIVVLSGAAVFRERTAAAAELYKKGIAGVVVVTSDGGHGGWSAREGRNPRFVDIERDNLELLGVPRERIQVVTPIVESTFEEAERVREFATRQGFTSIVAVTSGYHSRRAKWTFDRVFRNSGIEVTVYGVPPGQDSPGPAVWWLSPNGWRFVAAEWVKIAYYHLAH